MSQGGGLQRRQTLEAVVVELVEEEEEEKEEVNCLKMLIFEELGTELRSDLRAPSTSSVLWHMNREAEEAVRMEEEQEKQSEKG